LDRNNPDKWKPIYTKRNHDPRHKIENQVKQESGNENIQIKLNSIITEEIQLENMKLRQENGMIVGNILTFAVPIAVRHGKRIRRKLKKTYIRIM